MELDGEKKQSADSKTKGQKGKRMDLSQSHLCSNERKPPEDDRPQSWPGQDFSFPSLGLDSIINKIVHKFKALSDFSHQS
jgi:hypothetical protein